MKFLATFLTFAAWLLSSVCLRTVQEPNNPHGGDDFALWIAALGDRIVTGHDTIVASANSLPKSEQLQPWGLGWQLIRGYARFGSSR